MEVHLLQQCIARIEEQLNWGPSDDWTTNDFEELSALILEKTGHAMSSTTLKRVWGRVSYTSKPSRHSLDVLAAFLGYASWKAFAQETSTPVDAVPVASATSFPDPPQSLSRSRLALYMAGSTLLILACLGLWFGFNRTTPLPPAVTPIEEITFTSRPVAEGLPNTVVFQYNVDGVQADSFFIQQSWDQRRRFHVASDQREATSLYYYPGYYNAKLIADNEIIKEHPIHITTNGWVGIVEGNDIPVYLPDEALNRESGLSVATDWLTQYGFDKNENTVIGYYNVQDFAPVHTDNFTLELSIRNTASPSFYPCNAGELYVRGQYSAIGFSTAIPGCAGNLHVMASDLYLSGQSNDLTALAAEMATSQRIRLSSQDRNLTIQVGDNAPLEAAYTRDAGTVVGMWVRFVGDGVLEYARLWDGEGVLVYEEVF